MAGFVSIVGAGPWDDGLITVAGRDRLTQADVVIADYLVNPNLLLLARDDAEIIQRVRGAFTGPSEALRLRQSDLNALLLDRARAGKHVVRLKGGDPCMFGRGGEEAQELAAAGIAYELIPGVTSPIAAAELAGIPVTHRDHTPAVTFVSGFEAYEKAGLTVAWEHLAKSAGTIVLMMSVRNARDNAARLIAAGRDPATPSAVIRWGTRGIQRTITARLDAIADAMEAAQIRAPSILVVGDVVGLRETLAFIETRPLHGRRVVVTRSREQVGPLAQALGRLGADVACVPSLAIAPPADVAALDDAVAATSSYDGIIVSSPNGVHAWLCSMRRRGVDLRRLAAHRIAAVGEATAAACREGGIVPDVVPTQANSEGLARALREAGGLASRWLHVRGAHGRAVLHDAIAAAGGSYALAIGYRTILPRVPEMQIRSLLPAAEGGEGFDAICLASGKTAEQFVAICDAVLGAGRTRDLLTQSKVIAVGPVTASALETMGIAVAATAGTPSDAGLVAAVRSVLGTAS